MTQGQLHHQRPTPTWVTVETWSSLRAAQQMKKCLFQVAERSLWLPGRSVCLRVSLSCPYCLYMLRGEEPNEFGKFQELHEAAECNMGACLSPQSPS